MNQDTSSMHGRVMDAIRKGEVRMRPRWYFVLLSLLTLTGALIVFLGLLYLSSLIVFFWHDSGAWFAPSFGPRGWLDLVRATPWLLVILVALFALVLDLLVRKYAFVYRKSLVTTVLGILLLVTAGGFLVAQTPLHPQLAIIARHGAAAPIRFVYHDAIRAQTPDELYQGIVVSMDTRGLVMSDRNRPGTTTIFFTPKTRFPYGADFSAGEMVVVIGDRVGTDTIEAYGVRDVDPSLFPEMK